MWDEFYNWIEQYSGCRYDLTDQIYQIDGDAIFVDPDEWKINLNCLIDQLNDMLDVLDKHKADVTDNFPSYLQLRNFIIGETLTSLIDIINSIKQKLGIEPTNINDVDTLMDHALNLYELIKAVSTYTLEQLSKKDWFDEFEEDTDNFLSTQFGLRKNDLTSIQFTVNDIMHLYDENE